MDLARLEMAEQPSRSISMNLQQCEGLLLEFLASGGKTPMSEEDRIEMVLFLEWLVRQALGGKRVLH